MWSNLWERRPAFPGTVSVLRRADEGRLWSRFEDTGGAGLWLDAGGRWSHGPALPGKHVTFDMLKEGKRDEVLAAMLTLYDVSKLRGA